MSSVSIIEPGELDLASVQDWISKLLQTQGLSDCLSLFLSVCLAVWLLSLVSLSLCLSPSVCLLRCLAADSLTLSLPLELSDGPSCLCLGPDIYRMKGVLNIKHADEMFVYHAVHMIFNHEFTEPWPEDKPRGNKVVFIGKNLDQTALHASFADCLATPANREKKIKALRFKVGQRVLCNTGDWVLGTITDLMWRSEDGDMDPGMVAPYQIELDDGTILSAPTDSNELIREAPKASKKRPRKK